MKNNNKKNDVEISEQELADLKAKANKILAFCRQNVLSRHPFIGTIAMNLDLLPSRDFRNPTAMTDGTRIWFDIDFLSGLSQEEREFVIAHEVWHNVFMHFQRKGTRQGQAWNFATDFEVNQALSADGFTMPKDCLWPSSKKKDSLFDFPEGLSAEEYYDLLMKSAKNMGQDGKEGEGQDGENGKSGRGGKKLSGQFDRHYNPNDNYAREAEQYDGNRSDKYGKVGEDPEFNPTQNMTDAQKQQVTEYIRQAIVSAAQQVERNRGELPGFIKDLVKDLTEPKISWRERLAQFVTATTANKTDWNKPNRRFAYSGTYLPSHGGEAVRIAIGVDTSGSCADLIKPFLSEIAGIARQFDAYDIHMIQCDTQVTAYDEYNEEQPLDPENNGIEFKGFGGTELKPIFDYVREHELDVDALLMFTDGYCEEFDEEKVQALGIPVLWTVSGQSAEAARQTLKSGEIIELKA